MAQVINNQEFKSLVLESKGTVLVDFFATWCGPCKMLAPILDEVSAEVAGKASVYKVDVDQSPSLAQAFNVVSVPTLAVFKDGKLVKTTAGVQPKQNILALLA